nr:MAG TPA: hypothetical protein [Caudoviricetes sp.]
MIKYLYQQIQLIVSGINKITEKQNFEAIL